MELSITSETPSVEKTIDETTNLEPAEENAEETRLHLGLLHSIFHTCCPKNIAVYMFILVLLVISMSDAASDMGLSFFLYSRGFLEEALTVLLVDYTTSLLHIVHFLTVSLVNKMPWWLSLLEILMFLLLNPIAPGICCCLWMIFRVKGDNKMMRHFHFLSKLTCLINGSFEAPCQIILLLIFFVTGLIQVPWLTTDLLTDSFGNKLVPASYLSVTSFILGWISIVKNVTDSYQATGVGDQLAIMSFVIPNIFFRTFCFATIIALVREYVLILVTALVLINFVSCLLVHPGQNGIHLFSTIFCSIFCVVGLPEDPTVKETNGEGSVPGKTLKKLTLLITLVSLPVITAATWAVFLALPDSFPKDSNIQMTQQQQRFLMKITLSGLVFMSIFSCILFSCTFNKKRVRHSHKVYLSLKSLLMTTLVVLLSCVFFPSGPQAVIIPLEQAHGGVKIFEGFSSVEFNRTTNCTIHDRNRWTCDGTQINITFIEGLANIYRVEENTLAIKLPGFGSNLLINSTVRVFPAEDRSLTGELDKSQCLECNDQVANNRIKVVSNRCKNIIKGHLLKEKKPCLDKGSDQQCKKKKGRPIYGLDDRCHEQEAVWLGPNFLLSLLNLGPQPNCSLAVQDLPSLSMVQLIDGWIHVCGGQTDDQKSVAKCFRQQPPNKKPVPITALGTPRYSAAQTLFQDRWWISGGVFYKGDTDYGVLATSEQLVGGAWLPGPSLPWPRFDHCALTLLSGIVLVVGGSPALGGGPGSKTAAILHPDNATFTHLPDMTVEQKAPSCAEFRKRVYVLGEGIEVVYLDILTSTWNLAPSLPGIGKGGALVATTSGLHFVEESGCLLKLQENNWTEIGRIKKPVQPKMPVSEDLRHNIATGRFMCH